MVGYAIHGIHLLKPAPDEWLKALNPQVCVFAAVWENQPADSLDKFRAYAEHLVRLLPKAVIGIRWWHDDNILLRFTPVQFAQNFFPLHVPGTILMVGNEDAASETDPSVYANTVKLHRDVLALATALGIPLGVCCTPMGVPQYGQYELLQPLFDDMAAARRKGVVHWWRPNTYTPYPVSESDRINLVERDVREASKLHNFPPTFFGEFNFIKSIGAAFDGPNSFGMTGAQFEAAIEPLKLGAPTAIYGGGDGIFDSKWASFNVFNSDIYRTMINDLPRSPRTAYEDWKFYHGGVSVIFPDTDDLICVPGICTSTESAQGANVRENPSLTAKILTVLRKSDPVMFCSAVILGKPFPNDGYEWTWLCSLNGWVANVAKIAPLDSTDPGTPFTLTSPLPSGVVTAKFGQPRDYDGDGIKDDKHEGTDYAVNTKGCAIGTVQVLASAAGVVDSVRDWTALEATGEFNKGYGIYVKVRHVHGVEVYVTWYCHLSAPMVCVGDVVKQGQPVGILGSTGNSTGPHCHLNLQHIGHGLPGYVVADVVDPESYMVSG